jgi:hypothetical protein
MERAWNFLLSQIANMGSHRLRKAARRDETPPARHKQGKSISMAAPRLRWGQGAVAGKRVVCRAELAYMACITVDVLT